MAIKKKVVVKSIKAAKKEPLKIEEKSQFDAPVLDLPKEVNYDGKVSNSKRILPIVLIILVLAASGAAVYSYNLYKQSQDQVKKLKNPQEVSKLETKQIVETVGKLIDLPANETPTVATVTDSKKLKNQAFFAKAQNGDKVLIYTQSKKAILYSPTKNKIINVAPINIGQTPSGTPAPSGTAVSPTQAPVVAPTATVIQKPSPTVVLQ